MNKEEFLQELADKIKKYSKKEIDSSVSYYREMIEDRIEDGMSEEEVIASLVSIDNIVRQIEQEYNDNNEGRKNGKGITLLGMAVILVIAIIAAFVTLKISDTGNDETNKTAGRMENTSNSTQMAVNEADKIIAKVEQTYDISGTNAVQEICTDLVAYKVSVVANKENTIRVEYMDRKADPLYKVQLKEGRLILENTVSGSGSISRENMEIIHEEQIAFTLYIPEQYAGNYELNSTSTNMDVTGIAAKKDMEINLVSGNVHIQNVSVGGELNIDCTSGAVEGYNVTSADSIEIDAVSCAVDMTNIEFEKEMAVELVSGNVSLALAGSKNDYSMHSDVESGDRNIADAMTTGNKKLDISVTSGNMNVEFLKDK